MVFRYPYFSVKGHANNGTSKECIQVCAGITACVIGIQRLIDYTQYDVKCKSGLFEIEHGKKVDDTTYIDMDTNYALNTLLCQLYDLRNMYPSQFSKFEMIELKENEINGKQSSNIKPKPFRKLKEERLGSSRN